MRILLIAGGWSNEREVSLSGACGIEAALLARGHTVTFCDLSADFDNLMALATAHDFAFINLHGAPGEDGIVQAVLDAAGCPYQGSGARGSLLALHKAASKQIFRHAGLLTPDWEFLPTQPAPPWQPALAYPLFVKSNTGGSSILLGRVHTRTALDALLGDIFTAGCEALIETALDGVELTCGVLGDMALPPILIRPIAGAYFDYTSKYVQGGAEEICPAPLPEPVTRTVQDMALRAHNALGLEGYSRADFCLTPDNNVWLLETNTLPGMTGTSLIPQEAAVLGMDLGDLLERLIGLRLCRTPLASVRHCLYTVPHRSLL